MHACVLNPTVNSASAPPIFFSSPAISLHGGGFYGLRDFIHLLLYILEERKKGAPFSPKLLYHALERNFGGVEPEAFSQVVQAFFKDVFKVRPLGSACPIKAGPPP